MNLEIIYSKNTDSQKFAETLNGKFRLNGINEVETLQNENLNPDTIQGIIIISLIGEVTKMVLISIVKSIKEAMQETDEYTMKIEVKTKDKTYNGLIELEEETDEMTE